MSSAVQDDPAPRVPAPRSRLDDRRPGTSPMRTKIGPLFAQTNVPLQGRDRPAVGPAWRRRGDSPFASWGLPILDLCCIIPIVRGLSSAVECLLAKEKVKGSNPLARSRRRSQVVRQGSAKALFVGSIPTVASHDATDVTRGHQLDARLCYPEGFRGAVAELADAGDLKSSARESVWVRPPPALL